MKQANTLYLVLICLVSAMGGLLFGYDWVVIGGAKIFYEPFFGLEASSSLRGWAMSSALVGCLIGALVAGVWSDKYGRKKMLIVSSFLFVVAAIGTGMVDQFSWFIIYRIIGGFGIGIASNVSPIYIAEVSAAKARGRFVSLNQLTIVLGILAAQLANWQIGLHFTNNTGVLTPGSIESAWRWMFWAGLIPAGLFFMLSFIIPESPRWLAVNQKEEAALKVFANIGGQKYAEQALAEIRLLHASVERSNAKALFRPEVRRLLILGIGLSVLQQWCGINVIFNYAHEIFSAAGYAVSDILMNIAVTGFTNLIFTFIAIRTVDKWGRRNLMLTGWISLSVIYTLMGAFYYFGVSGLPMLFLVVFAIASYAMSLGPVVWIILSEIFPVRIRGAAMAVSTFFLWLSCFILTYTFPLLNHSFGAAGTFWIYGSICVFGFFFIHNNLPETKGKSLEEIERGFTKTLNTSMVSAR